MLIRFKVTNFLSFKDEAEFSMVAGRERIHSNHVVRGKGEDPNLLRAALIYGANGAGKSNFVKAISFAKTTVLRSRIRIPSPFPDINLNSFMLDEGFSERPSEFIFEIAINNVIYEYGFKVIGQFIREEWLNDISKSKLVFRRTTGEKGVSNFDASTYLQRKVESEFLKFVEKSVNPAQLFLTHAIANNVQWFNHIYDWFDTTLTVVFPQTIDGNLEEQLLRDEDFKDFFTEFMKKAGTGISDVSVRHVKRRKSSSMRLRQNTLFSSSDEGIDDEDEFETILRMYLLHKGAKSDSGPHFVKGMESDGTQRLFDLMSPLYTLLNDTKQSVYIIDELERSLHANVSYMLLKSYLEECHNHNSQLIATTHQTHLLDLSLLRRDEIWFAEKNEEGATQLYSLYEFNPRYDKKIEKEYLTGRFGAIPFLGNFEFKRKIEKLAKSKK